MIGGKSTSANLALNEFIFQFKDLSISRDLPSLSV